MLARVTALLAVAFALFLLADALVFRTGLYHSVLNPASSTGSFEAMLAREQARPADPRRNVLVIGDSRIVEALWPERAESTAGGLELINAAIPGTTPRCWYYFLRDLDPQARKFRAVVIPFDTYNDDDSAIGAPDANEHIADLHYIVYRLRPSDWIDFAFSMHYNRSSALLGEIFRGLVLKDDVQSFLAAPAQRLALLHNSLAAFPNDDYSGRRDTLSGLHLSSDGSHLIFPPSVVPRVRKLVTQRVLTRPVHNPAYAAYREKWIGRILAQYANSATRIIFVREPAMPLDLFHPATDEHSSVRELARRFHVLMLHEAAFTDLQQPRYFSDHTHLDAAGRAIFSDRFGADISRALESEER